MYEPKFTYTDRLVSQLIKIENNKTTLQSLDLNYNVRHKLTNNAKALDMFHLAHMMDIEITLKDGEKLSNGIKIDGIDDTSMRVIQNFRNVLEFNRSSMVDTYSEMDYAILMHLNKLIVSNWRESWEAKFRGGSDLVDERWDDMATLRDETIDSTKVEKEMYELIDWYKTITPTLTPLARLSILVYRMIEIYPFIAGNKLTLMATVDYLLLKFGMASKSYMSVVRNFDINYEKYVEAIYLSRKNFDLSFWLETFIESLNKDLIDIRESINDYIIEEEKSKKQPFLDLNKRQLKVLRYLQTVPMIKREDYCHMMEVSTMTAFRDLNDLVRKKLLKVDGQGRGTKYRLSSM